MIKILRNIVLLVFGTGLAVGAPVVPVDMRWIVSYETSAFETSDGDLGLNEYAIKGEDDEGTAYYIRTVPKSEGQFVTTYNPEDIVGKKQVGIRCNGCAFYSEFQKKDGSIVRVTQTEKEYFDVAFIKDYPQPKRTELLNIIDAAPSADAAIAIDNTSEATAANAESISWSHTVNSASDGAVVVNAVGDNDGYNWSATLSTFNSTAMTRAQQQASGGGASDHVDAIYVLATSGEGTGSKTVYIEHDNGGNENIWGSAHTYTGVDQTTPYDGNTSSGGDDGTDPLSLTVTSASGDLVSGLAVKESENDGVQELSVGSGQTERTAVETDDFVSVNQDAMSSDEAGASSVTHSYSRSETGTAQWTILAVNINAAAVGGADPVIDSGIIWFNED